MVGLATLAEFTNGIETVLDRVRAGSLAVDSDIITTLLEARDHLAAMVEAEAAKSPIPPSPELSQRLNLLLRGMSQQGRPPGGGGGPASPPSRPSTSSPPAGPQPPPPSSAAGRGSLAREPRVSAAEKRTRRL